ncbi:MAG: hypothetical protein HY360_19245 [Verrucomicrobia bacterium]|nr:hypothetical protein [Verrucomicrobiota bacterium]
MKIKLPGSHSEEDFQEWFDAIVETVVTTYKIHPVPCIRQSSNVFVATLDGAALIANEHVKMQGIFEETKPQNFHDYGSDLARFSPMSPVAALCNLLVFPDCILIEAQSPYVQRRAIALRIRRDADGNISLDLADTVPCPQAEDRRLKPFFEGYAEGLEDGGQISLPPPPPDGMEATDLPA